MLLLQTHEFCGQVWEMDIISQLQEQVNTIADLTFNTFGTLQRDAPPVRLSSNYPEPPPNPTEEALNVAEQTKAMSVALVKSAKQVWMAFMFCCILFYLLER